MKKATVIIMIATFFIICFGAVDIALFIGAGKLPDDFEEHESEYGFSIDLPEGWVMYTHQEYPGRFSLECYPREHGRNSKNPDVYLYTWDFVWDSVVRDLDDFVERQLRDKVPDDTSECKIAGRDGKRVLTHDDKYEFVSFYFFVRDIEVEDTQSRLYGRLSFRRKLSSFDDAEWNRFVERVAGSLEFED